MKKMKYVVLVIIFSFIFILASCGDKKTIVSYYLNDSGNLIAEYDNGDTTDLGEFADSIIKSIKNVSFSNDGYYVIGEIKTSIKVDFSKVEISNDGYYIVNGIKTTIKVDFSKVEMSNDGYYIINGIKTSNKVDFKNVEISDDGYYIINGIKSSIVATNIYTVDFENCSTIPSQRVREGYKVERPQNPSKEGYTFDGWDCNGEEWRFNSDVVMNDMTLTAKWNANEYTVSFIDDEFAEADIKVTFDEEYTLPVLSKDGYTFNGWLYNDEIVKSTKWNIASDVTLTSSWTANEYTVTLNPNGGNVSSTSIQVTYNENYKLPVPTNDFGVFRGWYIGDKKMTDENGNSLEKWTFTSNKTFTTDWIQDVSTVSQLMAISTAPNGYYRLVNDIDLTGIPWFTLCDSTPFSGVLDGNGYSINNMTITSHNSNMYALFGYVTGTIKNLKLNDVDINISSGQPYVAGLACYAENALFENITISGTIKNTGAGASAGGIAMMAAECSFVNVTNNANVTAKASAAGLYGYNAILGVNSFVLCINNGTITADDASGISTTGFFTNCKNTGTILGVDLAAGISSTVLKAEGCVNTGNVSSNTTSGFGAGIGCLESSQFQRLINSYPDWVDIMINPQNSDFGAYNSYNTGSISGKRAGGILSGDAIMYLPINCCYNTGSISANDYAGGIAPVMCNVSNCINFGTISGSIKSTICAQVTSTYKNKNCYYYGNAYDTDHCVATKTTERYSSELYSDLLGWNIYSSTNVSGVWKLNNDDYPTLKWEQPTSIEIPWV